MENNQLSHAAELKCGFVRFEDVLIQYQIEYNWQQICLCYLVQT